MQSHAKLTKYVHSMKRKLVPPPQSAIAQYTPFAVPQSSAFLRAVREQDYSSVAFQLGNNPQLIAAVDTLGKSALHWSVQLGNARLTALLLTYTPIVDLTDLAQRTPLYIAVKNDNYTQVKLLIEAGADPTLASMSGATPASLAQAGTVVAQLMQRSQRGT